MGSIKQNKFFRALVEIKDELSLSSQIEIIGNRQANIQGAKGIVEYNEEIIRVQLDNNEVQFYGTNLRLECLSQDGMEIKGVIHRIEYV